MRKSVPILLTPDIVRAMTLLVRLRSAVGIPANAVFQNADRIQSTKLRKYIATVFSTSDEVQLCELLKNMAC